MAFSQQALPMIQREGKILSGYTSKKRIFPLYSMADRGQLISVLIYLSVLVHVLLCDFEKVIHTLLL